MHIGVLAMQPPSPAVAGPGLGLGRGKGCMGGPRRLPPDVGTSAGTSLGPSGGVPPLIPECSRNNWLLNLSPTTLAEITRQHKLMHEAVAETQSNRVGRMMQAKRQSQRLINLLAQRDLQPNGERAMRSGVKPDGTTPTKNELWDICCILDALKGGSWPMQTQWQFLILWEAGDTTWEDAAMLARCIGLPALLQHLSDVERMRTHHDHVSRSMMGYDHPWMPKTLLNEEHNFGHDPLFYKRTVNR
jgi:hypothetical protein